MTGVRIFIVSMGIISPVGHGLLQTKNAIKEGRKGITPLSLFPTAQNEPLPVGEIQESFETGNIPRTHSLALIAAKEAMKGFNGVLDAVVMGVSTGGILTTEEHMKKGDLEPELFRFHSTGSVAEYIAGEYKCTGPVITVSTACSSGTVAIKAALEMLRTGKAKIVLAGGADSLCRLTYYGFNSLQLIDPEGARPFDRNRNGMSVSEGAAMLLLVSDEDVPGNAVAEVLGAGLSCDAYHPATPHPEGRGGAGAILAAVNDADISLSDIDYINLHGTGTFHNDLSEANALNSLFGDKKPLMSSVKGAFGHSLAAAGAIESVVSAISISENMIPANIGCDEPDPELNLNLAMNPHETRVETVLSNSFGFGGNNAAIVLGKPEKERQKAKLKKALHLSVVGCACITGAGDTDQTIDEILHGKGCKGMLATKEISRNFPPNAVRRLKRLPRMVLSLAVAAHENSELSGAPSAIFLGTGWGGLSETYDFLVNLYESNEQFASPTSFVGSVHNAPAGQVAIRFKATGPNITTTGGDYSFEQALMTASLLSDDIDADDTIFVIGADESHEILSPLFDQSVLLDQTRSDGGGALCLKTGETSSGLKIYPVFFESADNNRKVMSSLIENLGETEIINEKYGLVFAGIPAAHRKAGEKQLDEFLSLSGFLNPVVDYRKLTGEFASASAVAAVLAVRFVQNGKIPVQLSGSEDYHLNGKGILLIGLGKSVTAIEVIQ